LAELYYIIIDLDTDRQSSYCILIVCLDHESTSPTSLIEPDILPYPLSTAIFLRR